MIRKSRIFAPFLIKVWIRFSLRPVIEGDILKILDSEDDNNIVAEFKYVDGGFVRQ